MNSALILHDAGATEKFSARLVGVFHVSPPMLDGVGQSAAIMFVTN
jgi:hypothetical protein